MTANDPLPDHPTGALQEQDRLVNQVQAAFVHSFPVYPAYEAEDMRESERTLAAMQEKSIAGW